MHNNVKWVKPITDQGNMYPASRWWAAWALNWTAVRILHNRLAY